MALPALKMAWEPPMEERLGRLEANVEHIQSDVSDIKIDLRRLNDKVDEVDKHLVGKIDDVDKRLTAKIEGLEIRLTAKIDEVDKRLSAKIDDLAGKVTALALQMEKYFASAKIARAMDRVWWLLMCAAMLGVMARGFKWI